MAASSSTSFGEVSSALLKQQLAVAEAALQANQERQSVVLLEEQSSSSHTHPATQLVHLEQTVVELQLAQALSRHKADSLEFCLAWGQHLLDANDDDHSTTTTRYHPRTTMVHDFMALATYWQAVLVQQLRDSLRTHQYPTACKPWWNDSSANASPTAAAAAAAATNDVVRYAQSLLQLESIHRSVLLLQQQQQPSREHATSNALTALDLIVVELVRPFMERIHYHFIDSNISNNAKNDTATTTTTTTHHRVDRLVEWLLRYLKQHIFDEQEAGVWNWISNMLAPQLSTTHLPRAFVNELVRLIQYVVGERNVMRHAKLAGPHSSPLLLQAAIQEFLVWDYHISTLTDQDKGVLRLMDIFVLGDDELLQWWLQREHDAIQQALVQEVETTTSLPQRLELFAALFQMIQVKASAFVVRGPYWHAVGAPLGRQFVETVHAAATRYKQELVKSSSSFHFAHRVRDWIQLLDGMALVAETIVVVDHGDEDDDDTDDLARDLARFQRSLQNLETVVLEDFVTIVMERILMERAKFASYLMRCSSLVMADEDFDMVEDDVDDLPTDLQVTAHHLQVILRVCGEPEDGNGDDDDDSNPSMSTIHAAQRIRDLVLVGVADKLFEVALNWHGMTPDLLPYGCSILARHVHALFGPTTVALPRPVLRLLDCVNLMAAPASALAQLGDALCGLAGHPAPLTDDVFASDDRLYEEAMGMIRAKGYVWIDLDDVLSILNRRRDLNSGMTVDY